MFDIGFTEMLLVGLVALLAFGPERLPKVARETGYWIRKARSALVSVRAEIEHEMEMQDLKQTILEAKSARIIEPVLGKDPEVIENPPPGLESKPVLPEKTDG